MSSKTLFFDDKSIGRKDLLKTTIVQFAQNY